MYNDGTEEEYSDLYTYTADGAVQSVESTGSGRRYDYLYNLKGQVMEVTEYEKDINGNYVPLIGHLYQYDELDRPVAQQSIFQYAVGTATADGDVAYDYYYEDYEGATTGVPHVGELTALEISGAGYTDDAAITYGYDALYRLTTKTLALPSTDFFLEAEYGYTDTTRVNSYTSTAYIGEEKDEIVSSSSYSYAYNNSGNIIRIMDGNGQAIVYEYDDVGQLVRENNEPLGETYVYTYDYAGNRTSKKTYTYTIGSLADLTYTEIKYEYTNDWGDQLTKVGSTSIAYDALGNPTTYNGYALTWEGRQLMEMSRDGGQSRYTFEYNDEGIRTAKYSNGTWHYYTLEDSRIVTESIGSKLLVYLYDESGSPIGLQYRQSSYAANQYDTFFFEKNIFGDIVAVYNADGDKIGSYTYDAWGNCTVSTESGITVTERSIVRTYNPFRYRGYYYDTDIGLYYLQSRYYNPQWGRFLNADGYLNANGDLIGFNMYAYCSNNPVMLVDSSGNRAERIVRVNGGVVDQDPRTLRYFLYCLKQDMQAFDIDNASEDAVFAANYLAGYNGTVVVKTSLLNRSAFSFGIIVMGDKVTQPDTIKHEYGHHLQFKDMGLVNYSCYVAAPSLLHAGLRELGIVQNYHSLPWEYDANMRSGAQKGPYTVDAEARRQKWKLWMEASLWM